MLTPANVVEQFARQGSAYLARVIQLPGSASHMSFIDTIDTSTAGASLGKELQADILVDRAVGRVGADGRPLPCLKKHVCVFAARPGTALIIVAYADKRWSGE